MLMKRNLESNNSECSVREKPSLAGAARHSSLVYPHRSFLFVVSSTSPLHMPYHYTSSQNRLSKYCIIPSIAACPSERPATMPEYLRTLHEEELMGPPPRTRT